MSRSTPKQHPTPSPKEVSERASEKVGRERKRSENAEHIDHHWYLDKGLHKYMKSRAAKGDI